MLLNTDALQQGLVVTIVGMGVVFSFLIVMIISMNIMSAIIRLINKLFPEEVAAIPVKSKSSSSTDDDIMTAIAVAVVKSRF